jgi:hypothetical protein
MYNEQYPKQPMTYTSEVTKVDLVYNIMEGHTVGSTSCSFSQLKSWQIFERQKNRKEEKAVSYFKFNLGHFK